MAYGAGEADMAAAWEQYLQNHNVNHEIQLQNMVRDTESPTESKKKRRTSNGRSLGTIFTRP